MGWLFWSVSKKKKKWIHVQHEDVENNTHESTSKLYHGNRFILIRAWKIMNTKTKWQLDYGMQYSSHSGG